MDSETLISVIIAAYNHEKYVQETINSIINQTYKNLELIIIDDGSSDLTLQKIEEMREACANRFVRFSVKKQENQGINSTMNSLLKLAQGEFVFPIASDDLAAPNAIEELSGFLSKNKDYALAVGENKIIDKDGKQCYWDKNRNIVYDINNAFYYSYSEYLMKWATNIDFFSDEFGSYRLLLLGNHIPNGYLIRKNIFEKTGYYTNKAPLEDYYMFLQIAKYAKMKYIPKLLFYYRWHGTNAVKNLSKMKEFSRKSRCYDMELVEKSSDKRIKDIMMDYQNSFPANYLIKIPLIFEMFTRKSQCFRQINVKIFGISFVWTRINK